MFSVELNHAEIIVCQLLGRMRSLVARAGKVSDAKMGSQDGAEADVDGLMAEYAFCKHFNIFPDLIPSPRSGTFDAILNGKRVDVKSTRRKDGRLLATLKDNPDVDAYVLAIIEGNKVHFPGYVSKKALCKEENIRDLGHGKGYALDQKDLSAFK